MERTPFTRAYTQVEGAYRSLPVDPGVPDGTVDAAETALLYLHESARNAVAAVARRFTDTDAPPADDVDDETATYLTQEDPMFRRTGSAQLHDRLMHAYRAAARPVVLPARSASSALDAAATRICEASDAVYERARAPVAAAADHDYVQAVHELGADDGTESSDTRYRLEDIPLDQLCALLSAPSSDTVRYVEKMRLFDPALRKAHGNQHKAPAADLADDLQSYPDDMNLSVADLEIAYTDAEIRYTAEVAAEHTQYDAGPTDGGGIIERGVIPAIVDLFVTEDDRTTDGFRIRGGRLDRIALRHELDALVDDLLDPQTTVPAPDMTLPAPDADALHIRSEDLEALLREADEIQVDREEDHPVRDKTTTSYEHWNDPADDDVADLADWTHTADITLQQQGDDLYLRATGATGSRDQTVVARIGLGEDEDIGTYLAGRHGS